MSFVGIFPPFGEGFTEKEDARFYGIEFEDKTRRSESDGGYEFTRPKFTRNGRRTFKTGFTQMNAADFDIFQNFWDAYGGYKSFSWTNPADGRAHTVRFAEPPTVRYTGIGAVATYDVEVTLKQV
jgi:phage-related protein